MSYFEGKLSTNVLFDCEATKQIGNSHDMHISDQGTPYNLQVDSFKIPEKAARVTKIGAIMRMVDEHKDGITSVDI